MSARDQPSKDFGGRSLIGEFEYRTYLHGSPTHLLNDGADQRRDWMTLFLLALFHIQGRAKPGQHRGFLSMCENNGWLSLFSSNDRDPESWMQFVENYLDQQVDDAAYLHWMRQFVGIFQLNRHLDDYIECFLAIDRIEEPFSLTHILNSKSSHLFQGGGFDAPPLSRQLGLGACFVVRELVRLRVLKSQFAHVHSFVPTRRVRNLFSQLGCSDLEQDHHRWEVSSLICQFVGDAIGEDRACFGNDFDIPFQFIAEDSKLQETLLHCPLEIDESDESQDVFDWDIFTP